MFTLSNTKLPNNPDIITNFDGISVEVGDRYLLIKSRELCNWNYASKDNMILGFEVLKNGQIRSFLSENITSLTGINNRLQLFEKKYLLEKMSRCYAFVKCDLSLDSPV